MRISVNDGTIAVHHNYKRWLELSFTKAFGATIEFPSEWHEEQHGQIHIALFFVQAFIAFSWFKRYPDHYQCSGPKFGLMFNNLGSPSFLQLWIYYGNSDGSPKGSKLKIIDGPWAWGYAVKSEATGPKEAHDFTYHLRSGEIQHRKATIQPWYREWRRKWLPWKLPQHTIEIEFDSEVGERSGSWKGGVMGCGYDLRKGETPLQALRRMESERKL